MKKDGVCARGELCPYAHNVFEYWLHPTRRVAGSKALSREVSLCGAPHAFVRGPRPDPGVLSCGTARQLAIPSHQAKRGFTEGGTRMMLVCHAHRYRTQLCNDGTSCKRRVCFFAHTLPELRVPESKPFVNPQALAAAGAAAGARRSGHAMESVITSAPHCIDQTSRHIPRTLPSSIDANTYRQTLPHRNPWHAQERQRSQARVERGGGGGCCSRDPTWRAQAADLRTPMVRPSWPIVWRYCSFARALGPARSPRWPRRCWPASSSSPCSCRPKVKARMRS